MTGAPTAPFSLERRRRQISRLGVCSYRFRLLLRLRREAQASAAAAALARSVLSEQELGFAIFAVVSVLGPGRWPSMRAAIDQAEPILS
jgi:hypothetical protein